MNRHTGIGLNTEEYMWQINTAYSIYSLYTMRILGLV